MTTHITSPTNPHIKAVVKLADRRTRDATRRTVVEGVREVGLALAAGVAPVEAYVCPELIAGPEAERAARRLVGLAASAVRNTAPRLPGFSASSTTTTNGAARKVRASSDGLG